MRALLAAAVLLLLGAGFALAVRDYARGPGSSATNGLRPALQAPVQAAPPSAPEAAPDAAVPSGEPATAGGPTAAEVPPAPAGGGPVLLPVPVQEQPVEQPPPQLRSRRQERGGPQKQGQDGQKKQKKDGQGNDEGGG